jgi:putative ABC transport system permease protein
MFYELSLLAIGNLMRARARLIMTAGGVLVGTTAVILLIALTIGLQSAAEASIGNSASLTQIDVYPNYNFAPGSTTPTDIPQLTVKAVKSFWQIPGVAAVIPTTRLQQGEIIAGKYTGYAEIIGIDPRLLPYLNLQAQEGQLTLNPGDMLIGNHAADYFYDPKATGNNYQAVAVNLFETPFKLHLYQNNGSQTTDRKFPGHPTALLAENDRFNYSILMPIQDVLNYNEWITGSKIDPKTFVYDQVVIHSTSRETTNNVSDAIRKLGYSAGGMGEYLNQLNSFFKNMRLMLGGVGGVALLVAAFGVANTMTMSILERTKEIGLMKAIGATNQNILVVFLVEASLVGLLGGAAGVSLSFFLQNVINNAIAHAAATVDPNQPSGSPGLLSFVPAGGAGSIFVIPPELALFALALATAVGLGAGLYPALRAARLPPVIALKTE